MTRKRWSTISIEPTDLEELRRIAYANCRTVSGQVRHMIREASASLEEQEGEPAC